MRIRHIVTAIGTTAVVAVAYAIYAWTLGSLTDFAQLEESLRTPMSLQASNPLDKSTVRESEVAAVRGFGPGCREISSPLILESRRREDRGTVAGRGVGLYVYADTYELPPENPNQLKLKPFSLVNIVRSKDDVAEHDEIISMHGAEAILEFDRPIEANRLTGVNPQSGWVQGDVVLKTNRKTSDPSDDIVLFTNRLHYDRERNLVWADDAIKIVVESEGKVTGSGLELELHGPSQEGEKKKSAAKLARLVRDVRFELYVQDGRSFLGGGKAGPEAPATKTDVIITSHGPFQFDLEQDAARFEKMVRVLQRTPPDSPEGAPKIDQLEADLLTLQFDRGGPAKDLAAQTSKVAPTPNADGSNMRIRQAIATGEQVVLLSDSQSLQATGNYLEYDAFQRRVVLRGEQEMIAVMSNAVIHARSLVVDHDEEGGLRQLVADGPNGWMELGGDQKDKEDHDATKKPKLLTRWQGRLIMTRKPDSQQQIVHIDKSVELEHERGAMTCNELTVHLVPVEGMDEAPGRRKLEPVKLEAEGNVSAHSDRWAVNSETLLMDILHRQGKQGADLRPNEAVPNPIVDAATAPGSTPAQPIAKSGSPTDAQARPDERPLVIAALRVSIVVEQLGATTRPVSAWAEGDVRVTQTPSAPNESPVEIRGEQLDYKRDTAGDLIVVSGSPNKAANVKKSSEMYLEAKHRIVYQEGSNRVEVGGPGLLKLETNNSLTGRQDAVRQPIAIDWSKAMNFDGKIAYFEGDVKARQKDAEVWCQILQVTLDRRIDFRTTASPQGGEKTRPTIEYVHCDREVVVYDREAKDGVVEQQLRIKTDELRYDNVEGTVTVAGPGNVTIVEPNSSSPKGPPAEAMPFQVSMIDFQERMQGNRSTNVVKLYGGVHIVHTPVADPSKAIDEDHLPQAGMVINAGWAEMSQQSKPGGRKTRLFSAYDNVKVQSQGYWATCGRLGYNQDTDTLILAAEKDRAAVLYRQLRPGQPPESFPAREIRYDRRTGDIRTDGSEGFQSFDLSSPDRKPPRR